jgi:hypothetical protein
MNRLLKNVGFVAAMAVVFFMAGNVLAYDFGTNITISDGNASGTTGWYSDREDQETEPGMIANQSWDMEGFFQSGNILTMVAGYDFVNGNQNLMSGDLFFDINGDAEYGAIGGDAGNHIVTDTFGYDYVMDLNFQDFSYNVYALGAGASTITSKESANQGSNPWLYNAGGTFVTSGKFEYLTGLTDADTGLSGGFHNAVTGLNLSFLAPETQFMSHFTMQCGNDNLMGSGTTTPEPATMFLLGSGLIGLAGLKKKFNKKN